MYHLSGQDILHIWEIGQAQHPIDRALTIVALALPHIGQNTLADLSIGRRDALLFAIREQTFGAQLDSLIACPVCQERLEFSFDATAFITGPESAPEQPGQPQQVCIDGYDVQFRLPTSLDLAAIADSPDAESARNGLARRCILSFYRAGAALAIEDLPPTLLAQLSDHMAECEPQADVEFALACPACGHVWQTPFDIVSFLWIEICAQAKRLLRDVDTMARTYGWREADILSMSSARRQAYLEMVT